MYIDDAGILFLACSCVLVLLCGVSCLSWIVLCSDVLPFLVVSNSFIISRYSVRLGLQGAPVFPPCCFDSLYKWMLVYFLALR